MLCGILYFFLKNSSLKYLNFMVIFIVYYTIIIYSLIYNICIDYAFSTEISHLNEYAYNTSDNIHYFDSVRDAANPGHNNPGPNNTGPNNLIDSVRYAANANNDDDNGPNNPGPNYPGPNNLGPGNVQPDNEGPSH